MGVTKLRNNSASVRVSGASDHGIGDDAVNAFGGGLGMAFVGTAFGTAAGVDTTIV
jgi:hypothetical protein